MPSVPDPSNVKPWYLRNVTEALALDEATGNVYIRTGIDGDVIITGNVSIPTDINSHIVEVGGSGNLEQQGINYMPIGGNVVVTSGNISLAAGSNYAGRFRITDGTNNVSLELNNNDGEAVGTYSVPVENYNMVFNGTTWDRMRGNVANGVLVDITNQTLNANVSGNVNANVSGNVAITSLPEVEIKNDTGNAIPVTWIYGNSADAIPWEVQVARGKIPGVQGLSISGYQPAVPDTWVPIWGNPTAYTYFSSAQQVRIWSSSASDTNLTILVSGLDASYNILTETVVLNNGITGVLTSNNFFRVNSIAITADPVNVGTISASNGGKTITLTTIEPGAGRSQMTIYTVPAGYTFYLTQVNVFTNQVGSQTGLYRSYTKSATGVVSIILTFPFTDNYTSRKVVPRPYPEKTDIQWQSQSSQGTSRVGGQIEGYLIANSVT